MTRKKDAHTVHPLLATHIAALQEAVDQEGQRQVLRSLPISRNALKTALAGLPTHPGTRVKIEAYLDQVREVRQKVLVDAKTALSKVLDEAATAGKQASPVQEHWEVEQQLAVNDTGSYTTRVVHHFNTFEEALVFMNESSSLGNDVLAKSVIVHHIKHR